MADINLSAEIGALGLSPGASAALQRQLQSALNSANINITPQSTKGINPNAHSSFRIFKDEIDRTNKEIQEFVKHQKNATGEIASFGERVGFTTNRLLAYVAAAGGIYQVGAAFRHSAREITEINAELNKLTQILEGNSAKAKSISKEVLQIAERYGQSGTELLKIANTIAQAGNKFPADNIAKTVEALAKTGVLATFGDLERTTEGLIAVLNQFNETSSKTVEIIDIANQLSKKYAFESENLFEAVRSGGSAFAVAGGNIKEFAAVVASLRQLTRLSDSTIGTGLNTIALRSLRPDVIQFTEQLVKSRTGGTIREADGSLKSLTQRLIEVGKAVQSLDDEQVGTVIERLSGIRQGKLLAPLLRDIGLGDKSVLLDALKEVEKAPGTAFRDAAIGLERIDVQLASVAARFEQVFGKLSDDPGMKRLIQDLATLAKVAADVFESIAPFLPILLKFGAIKLGLSTISAIPNVYKGLLRNVSRDGSINVNSLSAATTGFPEKQAAIQTIPSNLLGGTASIIAQTEKNIQDKFRKITNSTRFVVDDKQKALYQLTDKQILNQVRQHAGLTSRDFKNLAKNSVTNEEIALYMQKATSGSFGTTDKDLFIKNKFDIGAIKTESDFKKALIQYKSQAIRDAIINEFRQSQSKAYTNLSKGTVPQRSLIDTQIALREYTKLAGSSPVPLSFTGENIYGSKAIRGDKTVDLRSPESLRRTEESALRYKLLNIARNLENLGLLSYKTNIKIDQIVSNASKVRTAAEAELERNKQIIKGSLPNLFKESVLSNQNLINSAVNTLAGKKFQEYLTGTSQSAIQTRSSVISDIALGDENLKQLAEKRLIRERAKLLYNLSKGRSSNLPISAASIEAVSPDLLKIRARSIAESGEGGTYKQSLQYFAPASVLAKAAQYQAIKEIQSGKFTLQEVANVIGPQELAKANLLHIYENRLKLISQLEAKDDASKGKLTFQDVIKSGSREDIAAARRLTDEKIDKLLNEAKKNYANTLKRLGVSSSTTQKLLRELNNQLSFAKSETEKLALAQKEVATTLYKFNLQQKQVSLLERAKQAINSGVTNFAKTAGRQAGVAVRAIADNAPHVIGIVGTLLADRYAQSQREKNATLPLADTLGDISNIKGSINFATFDRIAKENQRKTITQSGLENLSTGVSIGSLLGGVIGSAIMPVVGTAIGAAAGGALGGPIGVYLGRSTGKKRSRQEITSALANVVSSTENLAPRTSAINKLSNLLSRNTDLEGNDLIERVKNLQSTLGNLNNFLSALEADDEYITYGKTGYFAEFPIIRMFTGEGRLTGEDLFDVAYNKLLESQEGKAIVQRTSQDASRALQKLFKEGRLTSSTSAEEAEGIIRSELIRERIEAFKKANPNVAQSRIQRFSKQAVATVGAEISALNADNNIFRSNLLPEIQKLVEAQNKLLSATDALTKRFMDVSESLATFIAKFEDKLNSLQSELTSRTVVASIRSQLLGSVAGGGANLQIPERIVQGALEAARSKLTNIPESLNVQSRRSIIRETLQNLSLNNLTTRELNNFTSIELLRGNVKNASEIFRNALVGYDIEGNKDVAASIFKDRFIEALDPTGDLVRSLDAGAKKQFDNIIVNFANQLEKNPNLAVANVEQFVNTALDEISSLDKIAKLASISISELNLTLSKSIENYNALRNIEEKRLEIASRRLNLRLDQTSRARILGEDDSAIISQLTTIADSTIKDLPSTQSIVSQATSASDNFIKVTTDLAKKFGIANLSDVTPANLLAKSEGANITHDLQRLADAQLQLQKSQNALKDSSLKASESLHVLRTKFQELSTSISRIIDYTGKIAGLSTQDLTKSKLGAQRFDTITQELFKSSGVLGGIKGINDLSKLNPEQRRNAALLIQSFGSGQLFRNTLEGASTFGEENITGTQVKRRDAIAIIQTLLGAQSAVGGVDEKLLDELINNIASRQKTSDTIDRIELQQLAAMEKMVELQQKLTDFLLRGQRPIEPPNPNPNPNPNPRNNNEPVPQVNQQGENNNGNNPKDIVDSLNKAFEKFQNSVKELANSTTVLKFDGNFNIVGLENAIGKDQAIKQVVKSVLETFANQLDQSSPTQAELKQKLLSAIKILDTNNK